MTHYTLEFKIVNNNNTHAHNTIQKLSVITLYCRLWLHTNIIYIYDSQYLILLYIFRTLRDRSLLIRRVKIDNCNQKPTTTGSSSSRSSRSTSGQYTISAAHRPPERWCDRHCRRRWLIVFDVSARKHPSCAKGVVSLSCFRFCFPSLLIIISLLAFFNELVRAFTDDRKT